MDVKDKIKLRQESNLKLLDIVKDYIENYPDLRFWQILFILKINEYVEGAKTTKTGDFIVKDLFNEESVDTLERVLKSLENAHEMRKDNLKESCIELYNDIENNITQLLRSRKDKNDDNEKRALFHMESLMCSALQQLDCIIEYLTEEKN